MPRLFRKASGEVLLLEGQGEAAARAFLARRECLGVLPPVNPHLPNSRPFSAIYTCPFCSSLSRRLIHHQWQPGEDAAAGEGSRASPGNRGRAAAAADRHSALTAATAALVAPAAFSASEAAAA
jgi:hypothetical protein